MSNSIVVEEGACGTMDAMRVKQQLAATQDMMRPMGRASKHEYLSSHSDSTGLAEPSFIRRSTCSDTDCGVMRARYIFL